MVSSRVAWVFLCLVVTGCGMRPEPVDAISIPLEFTAGSNVWRRGEQLTDVERQMLDATFRSHPSLVENPALGGLPVVFRADKQRRRVYWIHTGGPMPVWLCLEFLENRPPNILEGQGNPFDSPCE